MPAGRPTKYNEKIARLICERVATHDVGLTKLCEMYDELPPKQTIQDWRYKYPEFSSQYAQAKLKQAELLAESIEELASEKGTYIDDNGNVRIDPGFIAHQRLKIDARKWLASKLIPKVYGDRVENKVTVVSYEESLKKLS